MSLKIAISPTKEQVTPETGIGQLVLAQYKYLPKLDIEIVEPNAADVVVCHIDRENLPRVDVLICAGLYWSDVPHEKYNRWHASINRNIADSAREAIEICVPSSWVAEPFKRDMRISPNVIPHGIDVSLWKPSENLGYLVWNKNRPDDVCTPQPAYDMAWAGIPVVSTFGPKNYQPLSNFTVTGTMPHADMRKVIGGANAYLATTLETFGIGTLEALAAGVPILGYDWGGTADLVKHKKTGYLVEPGNVPALIDGWHYINAHRKELSDNARESAKIYDWPRVMEQYASIFRRAKAEREKPTSVSFVVPCFNYAKYLPACVNSIQSQSVKADEIIIVDDCSIDESLTVANKLAAGDPKIKVIHHERNQGVAAARNHGTAAAKGTYIVALDADDMVAQEFVNVCKKALDNNRGLGIAYTGLVIVPETGTPWYSDWPPEFDWSIMATPHNPPSNCVPSGAMFRKSMWERAGGWRQVYAPAEDTEFWVRGLSVGFDARKVTQDGMFLYRPHEGSASRTKQYHPIDDWHPWMRDKDFPFAAPVHKPILVRSYHQPLVSFIIPVGPGHEGHLSAAIDSILGQSFRNWELIVVNDSGSDLSLDLKIYPFVRQVITPGEKGPGYARNRGLNIARGQFTAFLDADDYIEPDFLKLTLDAFTKANGHYIYTDYVAVGEKVEEFQAPEYNPFDWFKKGIHGITVLIQTEQAKRVRFDETLRGWEDTEFFVHCATLGIEGQRLPAPLFYYRTELGHRRVDNFDKTEEYLNLIKVRYSKYLEGVNKMPGCCGGNAGDVIMAAKRALSGMDEPLPPEDTDSGIVRMEWTRPNLGALTVTVNGRSYRGGNNAMNKYINAPRPDVEELKQRGWKVVSMPMAVDTNVVKAEPKQATKTEGELQAEARARMDAARAELAKMPTLEEILAEPEQAPEPVRIEDVKPTIEEEPVKAKRGRKKAE